MTLSPAELALLPTAPTVSSALREASRHAALGPIPALCKAVYGSADPDDYAAVISPEHVLAWGLAIIASARVIDPAVSAAWPDQSWPAGRTADTVGTAHRLLTEWAELRNKRDLAALFAAASREVREAE
ncbi:hypothetical protein OTB20_19235 [Streptomyces sp. H27-H1]|uniref:hypothetical protein n=1 Tax=Streptomyces sp. H27-H1 TaxID=2996461 RepID=UPI0022721DD4|nr:hypothetical protein [Streptomyces sp. H27-H1]MCY0928290.1 hypothetical protein [Streptomyces sp. H27-H1]